MNSVLIYCVVTLLLIAVQYLAGKSLQRSGKPYKASTLVFHILLALAITAGVSFINVEFQETIPVKQFPVISMGIAGLLLWVNIITGIILAVRKKVKKGLVVTHKISMFLIAFAIAVNSVLLILGI